MIEILTILSTLVLGLFAGGMLTEALLLVPYFRSLSFDDFKRLRSEFGPRLYRYYSPLTITATLVPLVAAAATLLDDPSPNLFAWLAVALVFVTLATYVFYFRAANLAFAEQRFDEPGLTRELSRWAAVHAFRTAVSLCAFVAAVLATLQATGGNVGL